MLIPGLYNRIYCKIFLPTKQEIIAEYEQHSHCFHNLSIFFNYLASLFVTFLGYINNIAAVFAVLSLRYIALLSCNKKKINVPIAKLDMRFISKIVSGCATASSDSGTNVRRVVNSASLWTDSSTNER